MKYLYLAVALLFVKSIKAQNCDWELINLNNEMTRMLSKPIDIGGKEFKSEILIQGLIKDSQRFILINFKNSSIEFSKEKFLILKTNERIYALNNISVDNSKFDLGTKAITTDISKTPKSKMTYLSDSESSNSRYKVYLLPAEDIKSIPDEVFTSILIGKNIELQPSKKSLKKVSSMIKCLE